MTEQNFIDDFKIFEDKRNETVEKIKSHNLPVIIWGAAGLAKNITEDLADYGIKVSGYAVDEKYYKPNQSYLEQPVYNFDELSKTPDKYVFVFGIGKISNENIVEDVKREKNIIIYGDYCQMPDECEPINPHDFFKNKSKFFATYNMLEDDLSRQIMIAYLKAKLSKESSYIIDFFNSNQYFNKLTLDSTRGGENVYVDCGAFDGDSVEEFINFVGGNYKKIFALEPDKNNFEKLEKFISEKKYENVELFKCGAWNEKNILSFTSGRGIGSAVSETGDLIISADKIDNIVGDEKVTFIKMDIEGAELNALEGAAETIRKCTPTLSICVYHKRDDLITIPQYIKILNPNYKFYLRYHGTESNPSCELVLYAVP